VNYFFITGTSRGIGKALAEELLSEPGNLVTGISRGSSIHHKNYKHIFSDLAFPEKLNGEAESIFVPVEKSERIVLINNAGTLGEVGYLGEIENKNLIRSFQVNITSAAILMNEFIRRYKDLKAEKIIINVSSGAGKKPLDGWGTYCASKSALDMLSEVAALEEKIRDRGFRIFSVAPGIVDTEMQSQVRDAQLKDFSTVEKFRKYKKEGDLLEPSVIAGKFLYLINNADKFGDTVISLRAL
jgi:benzil reductase ((S)-benzoin forming)